MQIGSAKISDLMRAIPRPTTPRLQKVEAWRIAQTRLRRARGVLGRRHLRGRSGIRSRVSLPRRNETGNPVTVGNLPTMYVRVET